MAGVGSKPQPGSTPMPDDDPLFGLGVIGTFGSGWLPCFVCNDRRRDGCGRPCRQPGDDPEPLPPVCSPVVIAAVSFDLGPSVFSATLGALAYVSSYWPRYSLPLTTRPIRAIGLLFVIGLIVSSVAFTSRRRATEAALLRRQATVLQGYSRDVVAADNTMDLLDHFPGSCSALRGSCRPDACDGGQCRFSRATRRENPRRPNSRRRYRRWQRELSCARELPGAGLAL